MGENELNKTPVYVSDQMVVPTAPEPTEYTSRKEIKEYNTELYLAASNDDLDEIVRLLDLGAEINHRCGSDNESILHIYAHRGDTNAVEYLLSRKADPNRRNCDFWTPLHEAMKSGELETARILISNGADTDALGYSQTSNGKIAKRPIQMCPGAVTDEMLKIIADYERITKKVTPEKKDCCIS